MAYKAKFLNSIYSNQMITSILEEAIDGRFQLTFINENTGVERALSRADLSAIRTKGPNGTAEVVIERSSSQMVGGGWPGTTREIISFGRTQNVGYRDLRADELNLPLIRSVFGEGDHPTCGGLAQPQHNVNDVNDSEPSDEELDDRYFKNPADRDRRLLDLGLAMYLTNPGLDLNSIHELIKKMEQGKSDVSIDVLKRVVQLKRLKFLAQKVQAKEKVKE